VPAVVTARTTSGTPTAGRRPSAAAARVVAVGLARGEAVWGVLRPCWAALVSGGLKAN
jgi:hypothetical protein